MLRFVKIQRKAFMALAVPFEIAIDSEIVDSISYKRTSIFPIAEGLHQLNFVFKGTNQPVTEIPDGTDNLVFEDKLKMGLLTNQAVLKYVGIFDASSVKIDDCPPKAVKKCCDTYAKRKKYEIYHYLEEFRRNPRALETITQRVVQSLLDKELVYFRTQGRALGIQYAMDFKIQFDHNNGNISWYNYYTKSETYCLTINIDGWDEAKKYAFHSALTEQVGDYCQWRSNSEIQYKTGSYDRPEVIFSKFENIGWLDGLDPINGYYYSMRNLGDIFIRIKAWDYESGK